ncbi:MAG: ankyrin repeat domain-containing protein [Candidatus Micrarchaeota archaeon]|nr:ankyrin repeat domain-containing protein [Candidatus Micrarchaeota archaeon]
MRQSKMIKNKSTEDRIYWNHELFSAARKGHTWGVKRAISNGAELEFEDELGWTALKHAIHSENSNSVKALLQAGADPRNYLQYVSTKAIERLFEQYDRSLSKARRQREELGKQEKLNEIIEDLEDDLRK